MGVAEEAEPIRFGIDPGPETPGLQLGAASPCMPGSDTSSFAHGDDCNTAATSFSSHCVYGFVFHTSPLAYTAIASRIAGTTKEMVLRITLFLSKPRPNCRNTF